VARDFLAGQRAPRRDVVILNAAAALIAAGRTSEWSEALDIARRSLDEGRATEVLDRLVSSSQAARGPA